MLHVTSNLIMLERGAEELLLVNAFEMRPLYVRRGRERFKRIVERARTPASAEELTTAFPADAAPIRLLRDFRILVEPGSREREETRGPRGRRDGRDDGEQDRVALYLLVGESLIGVRLLF